jgi:formylglycine-generating enzyme required for sulfatase activity
MTLPLLLLAWGLASLPPDLLAQRQDLLPRIARAHHLTPAQLDRLRAVFDSSDRMGQGNPAITVHGATREQCAARLAEAHVTYEDPAAEATCGGPYMAPLYDPATQSPGDARACIDRFEFPDVPCEYPVVWTRAREASEACQAMGKRLCDAHEWEGACAGALLPPDYGFPLPRGLAPSPAVQFMRARHNSAWGATRAWSYGPAYRPGVCGTGGVKSAGCPGGSWTQCGSNTFPAGYFPECRSALGVYDLHGNAAEHMNLPLDESQMASRGSTTLGYTEMKGSWFVFDTYYAHQDWCRWRAPFWHGSRVLFHDSHRNYHLGFRCCRDLR